MFKFIVLYWLGSRGNTDGSLYSFGILCIGKAGRNMKKAIPMQKNGIRDTDMGREIKTGWRAGRSMHGRTMERNKYPTLIYLITAFWRWVKTGGCNCWAMIKRKR